MLPIAIALILLPVVVGVYAYAVYPLALAAIARMRAARPIAGEGALPTVTIVIPAYNEQLQIAGAMESALAQTYPPDRRQILVLSDASTDATDDIVRGYAPRGVELLRMPVRKGKTAAENASVPMIRGEIVINTDSSVRLHPDAVRQLVAAMGDPHVGVASSRDVSVTTAEGNNTAEARYVDYEMAVRSLETRTGGIVGASGSGYAIRVGLHRHPVLDDLSRDFSASLTAHRHGYSAVSVDDAICYVPRTTSLSHEYRRKVRTISRGMETLYFNRDLLDPIHHGVFAWKLLSHKLARWMLPLSAIPAAAGLVLLAVKHPWVWSAVAVAALLLVLSLLGANWPATRPVPRWLPMSIVGALASNLAVVHAAWRFFHGHHDHIWEPTRRPVSQAELPRSSRAPEAGHR